MATFGYTSIGPDETNLSWSNTGEYITGSIFTCPETGLADSIVMALKRNAGGSDNVKCALYKHSDLSLVGVTDQVLTALTTTPTFKTFPFSTKPTLENIIYLIVGYADYTAQAIKISYAAGAVDQMHQTVHDAYNGFPDPLGSYSHFDLKCSIYCNYTPPTIRRMCGRLLTGF